MDDSASISAPSRVISKAPVRRKGRVRRWIDSSYGFAEIPSDQNVFVHVSACPEGRPIKVGTYVVFDLIFDTEGRARAVNVVRVGDGDDDDSEWRPRFSNWCD